MKKIIITDRIKQYVGFELYPVCQDVEIFTACSNRDALAIHRKERADLIIAGFSGPDMDARDFCSLIRNSPVLCAVSIVLVCRDTELVEGLLCRANAVMTLPLNKVLLSRNVQNLLSIPVRCDYRLSISAKRMSRFTPDPFDCTVLNISIAGILMETAAHLNTGDSVFCRLVLPGFGPVEAQGVVARVESGNPGEFSRFGIRFTRLDPSSRRAIELLVEKKVKSPAVREDSQLLSSKKVIQSFPR